ncbi:alpha/beta fold hydrolase [Hymenobacter jejuensis]|uniref:Alpha/beta hydrolase n=1 Tax=Hymenobacter jejuensis TaxID=2502781 RepID=A0A5B7ZVF9_9BACT|nr:alpha/beta hydrolase [Hymenobacter jejuensis]QDA58779.1 alpha/beta hydrolase [Hymenobacter jejuensis]
MKSQFLHTNGIRLHYLDYPGPEPPLVLLHGLTANAYAFEGLIQAGLTTTRRILAVDLRGRGLSDKPATGYSMAEHAQDIIGLLDALQLDKAELVGHSFGALLSLYLAYHFPARVDKLVLLDAAARLHPQTREMLVPTMGRLGKTTSSFAEYLAQARQAPYLTIWDESMEAYYQADVQTNADGSVTPRSRPENIAECLTQGVFAEPWTEYIQAVQQPALLLNGTQNYALGAPLLPREFAEETVAMLPHGQYREVWGNHQTMLYGQGAQEIVQAITEFLA